MIDTGYWVALGSIATAILAIIGLLKFWPKRAKPKVLSIEKCLITIGNFFPGPFFQEKIVFELLIGNDGSKECSVIWIDLILLPSGQKAELDLTSLPINIPVNLPVKISIKGFCSKPQKSHGVDKKLTSGISAEQKTVETAIIIKFKNADTINESKTFDVKYFPSHT